MFLSFKMIPNLYVSDPRLVRNVEKNDVMLSHFGSLWENALPRKGPLKFDYHIIFEAR